MYMNRKHIGEDSQNPPHPVNAERKQQEFVCLVNPVKKTFQKERCGDKVFLKSSLSWRTVFFILPSSGLQGDQRTSLLLAFFCPFPSVPAQVVRDSTVN